MEVLAQKVFCCYASGLSVGDIQGDCSDGDISAESTVFSEQLNGVRLCQAPPCLHAEKQSLCHLSLW